MLGQLSRRNEVASRALSPRFSPQQNLKSEVASLLSKPRTLEKTHSRQRNLRSEVGSQVFKP